MSAQPNHAAGKKKGKAKGPEMPEGMKKLQQNKFRKKELEKLMPAFFSSIRQLIHTRVIKLETMILSASIALNILLAGALIFLAIRGEPEPRYFATFPDGRVINLQPLSKSVVTDDAVADWAGKAVTRSLTMSFADYDLRIPENIKRYFTDKGGKMYRKALVDSGLLREMEDLQYVMRTYLATDEGLPQVVGTGKVGNRKAWKVVVPVLMEKSGARIEDTVERRKVEVLVVRESRAKRPEGIAILQYVVK